MSPAFVAVPVILVFPIVVVLVNNDWDKLQLLVHWMEATVKAAFLHFRVGKIPQKLESVKGSQQFLLHKKYWRLYCH